MVRRTEEPPASGCVRSTRTAFGAGPVTSTAFSSGRLTVPPASVTVLAATGAVTLISLSGFPVLTRPKNSPADCPAAAELSACTGRRLMPFERRRVGTRLASAQCRDQPGDSNDQEAAWQRGPAAASDHACSPSGGVMGGRVIRPQDNGSVAAGLIWPAAGPPILVALPPRR